MAASSQKMVGATVVVDSRGTVISVAIDPEPRSPKGVTHGFVLEPGQRIVNVKIPLDAKKIDANKLMAQVRAMVPRPSKATARGSPTTSRRCSQRSCSSHATATATTFPKRRSTSTVRSLSRRSMASRTTSTRVTTS